MNETYKRIKFSDKISTLNTRMDYWHLTKKKKADDDSITYAGAVDRGRGSFKLKELTPEMFKRLIFVQGLTTNEGTEIRVRIASKLE